MLLKVLAYWYLYYTYSSRKLEAATHENIHFILLTGQSHPGPYHNQPFPLREAQKRAQRSVESGSLDVCGVRSLGFAIGQYRRLEDRGECKPFSICVRQEHYNQPGEITHQLEEIWGYIKRVTKEELADKPSDI